MQYVANYTQKDAYDVTLSTRAFDPFQLIPCRSFEEDVKVSDHFITVQSLIYRLTTTFKEPGERSRYLDVS